MAFSSLNDEIKIKTQVIIEKISIYRRFPGFINEVLAK